MTVDAATRAKEFTELLERHGADLSRLRGSRGVIPCVFPDHADRRASLSVDLDAAVFNCFACSRNGGYLRLAELLGEPIPVPRARPSRRRPELEDRRHGVMLWPLADTVRQRTRVARSLRAFATRLGPNAPGVWLLLAHAARLEREAGLGELALDAVLAEGRLP